MIVHYPPFGGFQNRPGGDFTPCGVRFLAPMPGTLHTDDCLLGREMCIGIHVLAVYASTDPRIVNCPKCIEKVTEETDE
jgi:hypothetical protein